MSLNTSTLLSTSVYALIQSPSQVAAVKVIKSCRHRSGALFGKQNKKKFCFTCVDPQLWSTVAKGLGAKRLAKMSRISRDGFRSPVVTMLLGEHSWVKHVDNGIG